MAVSTISTFLVKSFIYKIYDIFRNESDTGMKLQAEMKHWKTNISTQNTLRVTSKGKF